MRPGYNKFACDNYCLYVYDYVPGLPYNNAQNFNIYTRLCEAKQYCPRMAGVYQEQGTGKCRDRLLGVYVDPVGATPVVYKKYINVTVFCQHGKIIMFNGKQDCQCDMGWGTLPNSQMGFQNYIVKCG